MGRERNNWRPSKEDQASATGLRVREFGTGPKIELNFYYSGVRCQECLSFPLTPGNWKYAIRMRAEIYNAIERKTFRYGDYFPDSPRAKIFGHARSKEAMSDLFQAFIELCEKTVARGNMSPSTLTGYKKIIKGHLDPAFGKLRAVDLTPGHIKEWVLGQSVTGKTLRNRLSPLKLVLDEAVNDGHLTESPLARLKIGKLIEKIEKPSTYEIDPFDAQERAAFLLACSCEEERDNYTFWFETGLRPGEMIAVAWPKIDWVHGKARIDTNIVERIEKDPKTAAGIRDIDLSPLAIEVLQRQKARTFLAGGRIWRSSKTMRPWETDGQVRRTSYMHTMAKAGVRHRNMYQIRHTFASTHASSGANLFWLAGQMGHETIEMLIRNYARWIPGSGIEPPSSGNGVLNGGAGVAQKISGKITRIKSKK